MLASAPEIVIIYNTLDHNPMFFWYAVLSVSLHIHFIPKIWIIEASPVSGNYNFIL